MALVAAADPGAARALDTRLRARSFRIARSVLRNEADATDASQSSMVEIFRAATTYRGESSLEHWADRIVVRTSMRALAKRRAWTAPIDGGLTPDEIPVPASQDARSLLQHLQELPPPLRTVLVLKYAHEYSVEEIADLTDVPVNTVKDRLLRAKQAIRRVIRREELPDRPVRGGEE